MSLIGNEIYGRRPGGSRPRAVADAARLPLDTAPDDTAPAGLAVPRRAAADRPAGHGTGPVPDRTCGSPAGRRLAGARG